MSFLASSLTRFVATANSQARSFCMEVCLNARTNVSCATSSAQSRSPRRRVRYLTNAALYVRKSRSTSVTRLPAIPDQSNVTIRETLFPRRGQLDRQAASRYYGSLANRERLTQVGHHLNQLEVCVREWLHLQHHSRLLVANVGPHAVAQYKCHVAGPSHVAAATDAGRITHAHSGVRSRKVCRRALCRRRLGCLELNRGRSRR